MFHFVSKEITDLVIKADLWHRPMFVRLKQSQKPVGNYIAYDKELEPCFITSFDRDNKFDVVFSHDELIRYFHERHCHCWAVPNFENEGDEPVKWSSAVNIRYDNALHSHAFTVRSEAEFDTYDAAMERGFKIILEYLIDFPKSDDDEVLP